MINDTHVSAWRFLELLGCCGMEPVLFSRTRRSLKHNDNLTRVKTRCICRTTDSYAAEADDNDKYDDTYAVLRQWWW